MGVNAGAAAVSGLFRRIKAARPPAQRYRFVTVVVTMADDRAVSSLSFSSDLVGVRVHRLVPMAVKAGPRLNQLEI